MGNLIALSNNIPVPSASKSVIVQKYIMSDDFASGNLNSPAGGNWYASKNTSVISGFGRTGNHCLKFAFPGGPIGFAEQRYGLLANYNELWFTYYIYYPDGTEGLGVRVQMLDDPTSNDNNKFFRVWGSVASPSGGLSSTVRAGASTKYVGSPLGDGNIYLEAAKPRPNTTNCENPKGIGDLQMGQVRILDDNARGRWKKIGFHFKPSEVGQSNGIAEMMIDDVIVKSTFTSTHGPNDNNCLASYSNGYLLGATNAYYQVQTNIYIDNFLVSKTPLF